MIILTILIIFTSSVIPSACVFVTATAENVTGNIFGVVEVLALLRCYRGMQGTANPEEQRPRTLRVTGLASGVSGQGAGDPGNQVRVLLDTHLMLGPGIVVESSIRVSLGTVGAPGGNDWSRPDEVLVRLKTRKMAEDILAAAWRLRDENNSRKARKEFFIRITRN